MPWQQTDPMLERSKFIAAHQSGLYSMTELCTRFGISRKTGYKWLARYDEGGAEALLDRSRAPKTCSHRTSERAAELIVSTRQKHPDWGARKILAYLEPRHAEIQLPAASTATDLLRRRGLIKPRRSQRRKVEHPGAPCIEAHAPNQVWTADYKGEFLLTSGAYCYPLTVCDGFSRYLLACRGHTSTAQRPARKVFEQLFREYGLPRVIRTDNGIPFATRAIHGLSRLSVFWISLGIRPDRIEPGKPQQNGRHERMHRTLKAVTTRPPEASMLEQQRRFDAFRESYNEERPHEALSNQTPASCYRPSERSMPTRIPAPEYPGYFEVRRVSAHGTVKFKNRVLFLSHALAGRRVAFEEVDDAVWSVHFYEVLLGRFDERKQIFIP